MPEGLTSQPASRVNIISSGNPQLDLLLGGGFPIGNLIMLVGAPGTGKTTFALQTCFGWPRQNDVGNDFKVNSARVENGPDTIPTMDNKSVSTAIVRPKNGAGRAIYFSLLSESHDKLISHIGGFDFFKTEQLNNQVKFYSISSQMENGSKAISDFILKTVRQEKAGLIVLDGFTAMAEMFETRSANRKFLYTLSSQLAVLGTTILVTIERAADTSIISSGDLTVADGILSFTSRLEGAGEYFSVQVVKMRGMKRLLGQHSYAITNKGLEFYPRLEALVLKGAATSHYQSSTVVDTTSKPSIASGTSQVRSSKPRLTFNLQELESMLGGGLPIHSSTLVAGSVGVGKTLLGLHFLMQGADLGESGLYLGFYEDRDALINKGLDFGLDLNAASHQGQLDILTFPPLELEPDQIMSQLRERIEGRNIKRLVVDGFIELELACRSTNRSHNFAAAFEVYLKQQNITVLYTHTISKIVGSELDLSDTPFIRLAENLLLMRQGEYKNRIYRIISILKMRDSDYDQTIREFTIRANEGIRVLEAMKSAPGFLGGLSETLDGTNSISSNPLSAGSVAD